MTSTQRIVSLLPSTTEILYFLDVGSRVVGVTHECDYPPCVSNLPSVTRSLLPPNLSASEIDDAVAASMAGDEHTIYKLDAERLRGLKPDVILTQALCDVCAVPEREVRGLACTLPSHCTVIKADPGNLHELFDCIRSIGRAVGADTADQRVMSLEKRLRQVQILTKNVKKPRVCVLEWPSPPYAPGHWVPDQVQAAGGVCAAGKSGEKSRRITWRDLLECNPDVVVCAFCGYDLKENQERLREIAHVSEWKQISCKARILASNASAYFSRPGPRLIDGIEILAYALHGKELEELQKPMAGQMSELTQGEWIDLAKD